MACALSCTTTADQQRGLHRTGGDRRHGAPGVRVEATARGRVPAPDGRAIRVRAVHGQSGQVRRPGGGPARPVGRLPIASLPRIVRLPPRQLRQGPQPARPWPPPRHHYRQLARFLHLSSRQRRTLPDIFLLSFIFELVFMNINLIYLITYYYTVESSFTYCRLYETGLSPFELVWTIFSVLKIWVQFSSTKSLLFNLVSLDIA